MLHVMYGKILKKSDQDLVSFKCILLRILGRYFQHESDDIHVRKFACRFRDLLASRADLQSVTVLGVARF